MPLVGAQAAWHGYSRQTLYTLHRILHSPHFLFEPEGLEDLGIRRDDNTLLEVLQMKAYGDNLSLSDFDPGKSNSFFRRVLTIHNALPSVEISVISFGQLGIELESAWEGKEPYQHQVAIKLREKGYSDEEITILFSAIKFKKVDEQILINEITNRLRETLVGGDPQSSYELLTYWLYEASQHQHTVTQATLQEKLANVGRYIAERATYHQFWFTSIVPLNKRTLSQEEQAALRNSFYEGEHVHYDHILANVDIERPLKLQEIDAAFKRSRLVVVRGASGQGKSAVAFRYIHNFIPNLWRFFIHAPENQQQALSIARALDGQARAIGIPILVYLDVLPSNAAWVTLAKELSRIRNIQTLITIRAEDWRRADVRRIDFEQIEEVELVFDEIEAHHLYSQLTAINTYDRHLTFDDAWQGYGTGGVLLEFVYYLTQQLTLRDRLTQQVHALQDLVREGKIAPEELTLLRWGAVASALQARIDLQKLPRHLFLPEPTRTIALFEKEYLLRRTPDTRYLEGLHAVRSAILVDLLTDPILNPRHNLVIACLPVIVEDDWEVFLLSAFSRLKEVSPILTQSIYQLDIQTWTGFGGILRVFIWCGVRNYMDANAPLIREVANRFGQGWNIFLDSDLANLLDAGTRAWWQNFPGISQEMQATIERFRRRQTPKSNAFAPAQEWLETAVRPQMLPQTYTDWTNFAEVRFWTQFFHLPNAVNEWKLGHFEDALKELPLEVVGEVILSLHISSPEQFTDWFEQYREYVLTRFQEETDTISLEDDGETIRIHFLVNYDAAFENNSSSDGTQHELMEAKKSGKDINQSQRASLHDQTITRIELLHNLVPNRQLYGSQGYGHHLPHVDMPSDDTRKVGIPVSSFPPAWSVRYNAIFHQLGNWILRPATWKEYAEEMIQTRQTIVTGLVMLTHALNSHFRKTQKGNILDRFLPQALWEEQRQFISRPHFLPQCAVDEWGFVGEGTKNALNEVSSEKPVALWQYQDFLKAWDDYTRAMLNFYTQSAQVMATYQTDQKSEQQVQITPLSLWNIHDAFSRLSTVQKDFRHHFERLFPAFVLTKLEQAEIASFQTAFLLWYEFAHYPFTHWQNPRMQIQSKYETARKELLKRLRRQFRKLEEKEIQTTILKIDEQWEEKTVLWITVDVIDPFQMYAAFDIVRETLRSTVYTFASNNPLIRYGIQNWYEDVVIIPQVRGKALSVEVWKFSSQRLLRDIPFDAAEVFDRIFHPVPILLWTSLNIPSWDALIFQHILTLRNAIRLLFQSVSHLAHIASSPYKPNEEIKSYVASYIQDHSAKISNQLDYAFTSVATVTNEINKYELHTAERASLIAELIGMIKLVYTNLLPTPEYETTKHMNLSEVPQWAERLFQAIQQVEVVRLGLELL